MRLWSINLKYLDAKGLVALWREGLLAQKVLLGETKGYKNHPQLDRFKAADDPIAAITNYLWGVVAEADRRGYNFNRSKIVLQSRTADFKMSVTDGQLAYEFKHLLRKLEARDVERYEKWKSTTDVTCHPLFFQIDGEIADWEIV